MSRGIRAGRAEILLRIRDETRRGLQTASRTITRFSRRVALIGTGLVGAGGLGFAKLFAPAVRDFARIEQLLGRFDSVFRDLSKSAGKFADDLGNSINQSGFQIRDQLAQFQAVLLGFGFDPKTASVISSDFTAATQDLIAFDDTITDAQEATDRLLGGLTGSNIRGVRSFGANILDTNVALKLLELGINKTTQEATQSEKVLARYKIIMEALSRSGATGQAAREVNTLQARFRGLAAATELARFGIVNQFGDALATLVGGLTGGIRSFATFAAANERVATGLALAVPALLVAGSAAITLSIGLGLVGAAAGGIAAIGTSLSALAPAAIVLGGVSAAVLTLSNDLDGIQGIAENVARTFNQTFGGVQKTVGATIEGIFDALSGNQLELAARIGLTGLELAFRKAFSEIGETYKTFVEGIQVTNLEFAKRINTAIAKLTFGNVEDIQKGFDLLIQDVVDEQDKRREKEFQEMQALRDQLRTDREAAADARKDFEEQKNQQPERKQDSPQDAVRELEKINARRAEGTFSSDPSRVLSPTTEAMKDMLKEQKKTNENLGDLLGAVENLQVVRWA